MQHATVEFLWLPNSMCEIPEGALRKIPTGNNDVEISICLSIYVPYLNFFVNVNGGTGARNNIPIELFNEEQTLNIVAQFFAPSVRQYESI